jgi:hypothetical protein
MEKKIETLKKNFLESDSFQKNKRILFQTKFNPNNLQLSSQFRTNNKRYFEKNNEQKEEENKHKQKDNTFFNSTKHQIFNLSNDALKKNISKNKITHENNLKKIEEYEKQLKELEKNNNLLSEDINELKKTEDNLKNQLKSREDEEKELNDELNNLKNINEEKGNEFINLMNSNHINNNNNDGLNNNRQINNINMSNPLNNNIDQRNINQNNQIPINNALNIPLPIQRQVIGNNEEIGNPFDDSINNIINMEFVGGLDEDLGPPMTFQQINDLPFERYPSKDNHEKCLLCGFPFCFNDNIIKLVQCKHIFHKVCLGNFLMNRQASKCPQCKASLI